MIRAVIFAGIASIGNALFVFGQRGVEPSKNPFLFTCGAVLVCFLIFLPAAMYCHTPGDVPFLMQNFSKILISGIGFFITFFGFFLLYSRFGASYYIIYAVLSILTTAIGVGVLYYKEPFNPYHAGAMILAVLSIVLYSYGQYKAHL
jgi:drug/metabolite transporter (DMT)-like permease